ncbi:hypothetical protein E9549_05400 [Blastococcus sp. MG754426]|uniref:hypothetical protein n=1 Tax=unclassified Blastococcus TaxID=2619396 RepID=UPI001EF02BAB|nr:MULTISPECIES: hypothetical protein [unclassified Blastococcus]MCF6506843.1 hypothetical protein [Blastococcus sp. MG754426]MCF6511643.1 hypothetical protein [Blastococcus sp. MG754427]
MVKHFTVRDGLPFTFELARTEMPVAHGSHLARYWLYTLVDIHLGVLIDAMVSNPAMSYPPKDGSVWELLDFVGEDTELLTISIPDSSVLSDDELATLPWGEEIRVVRRSPDARLHPVHEAAIGVLLGGPDLHADPETFDNWFEHALEELRSYSQFEHTFSRQAVVGHRLNASYRQARTGDPNDEHSGHDFDPWCCGLIRLQALQVPSLAAASPSMALTPSVAEKDA